MRQPHSYFYANIPEKEKEWEQELIEEGIKSCIRNIDYLTDPACRKKIQQEWEDDLQEGELYKSRGFVDVDADEEAWYLELFKCVTLDDYITLQMKAPESLLMALRGDDLDIIALADERFDLYSSVFGDFIIHDRLIYRDTTHDRSEVPGVKDPVFKKGYRDIFRVQKFFTHNCYSFEDTVERIETENIDLTEQQLMDLREFWATYPKGAIIFR